MAKATLPVDFQDDIMSVSMGGKRRYRLIQNTDGTYSLEDATTYDQVGSNFGAGQINATNQAVNDSADASKIIDDVDDIDAVTEEGYIAGALALKQVNRKLPQYDESTDTVYLLINGEKIILKEYATSDIKYETFNNIVSGSAGNSVTFTNSLSFKPNEVLKVLITNATWSGNSGNVQLNSWSYNPSTNAITVSVSKDVDTNTATITYQIVYK